MRKHSLIYAMRMNDILHTQAGLLVREQRGQRALDPDHISHFLAAAGGPKWLVLNQLDRFLFGEWFRGRRRPLVGVGSSIGAWRLACVTQSDPLAAIQRFEDAYVEQRYSAKPSPAEISEQSRRIMETALGTDGIDAILQHPWLHLNIVTAHCRSLAAEQGWKLKFGLLDAMIANALHRDWLACHFQRVVFHSPSAPPVRLAADAFDTIYVPLTRDNLLPALMATAAVPMLMEPVHDIPGAPPGVYRDGGLIDYHMDLQIDAPEGIVFQPHFSARVVPGWLDKFAPWRKPQHTAGKLLVAPAAPLIAQLPGGQIPDRNDFFRYPTEDERIAAWREVLDKTREMPTAFMEYVSTRN